jgi:3D (Asp-Asp-Asp) domain-containing protein
MFSTSNQCIAKKINGKQCAKKNNNKSEFCGTHIKSAPYGCISNSIEEKNNDLITETLEVKTVIEKGIVYFVDKYNNVYYTEDIMQGINNPRIIVKEKLEEDLYDISIVHSNR